MSIYTEGVTSLLAELGSSVTLAVLSESNKDSVYGIGTDSYSTSTITAIQASIPDGSELIEAGQAKLGDCIFWVANDVSVTFGDKLIITSSTEEYWVKDIKLVRISGSLIAKRIVATKVSGGTR